MGRISRATVVVKRMDGFRVAYVTHRGTWADVGDAFLDLAERLWVRHVRPAGPYLALHERPPTRLASRLRVAVAAPIATHLEPGRGLGVLDVPASQVASLIYDGPPARLPEGFRRLQAWIRRHGLVQAGPFREIHAPDLSDLLPGIIHAEIQVPVRPRAGSARSA
jgi:DNA gyrase inhibitor GyrI